MVSGFRSGLLASDGILMTWTLYILECSDKTLYTGITTDLEKRFKKHTEGRGAKYTRGRGPYRIIYTEIHYTKSEALKREVAVKSMRKERKLRLISMNIL